MKAAGPGALGGCPDTDSALTTREEVEKEIRRIWAEALQRRDVGLHDHFLDLGGDSLVAMRIVARTGRIAGVSVHVSVLLEEPTVAAFAAAVYRHMSAARR